MSASDSAVPAPAANAGAKVKSVSRIATVVSAMPPSEIRSGNVVPKLSATLSPGSTALSFAALTRTVLVVSFAPNDRLDGEIEKSALSAPSAPSASIGMETWRSGTAFSVTATSTCPPSAARYPACAKLTVTSGSSSSSTVTVWRSPNATPLCVPEITTDSPSSSRSSSTPVNVAVTMDAAVPAPAGSVNVLTLIV